MFVQNSILIQVNERGRTAMTIEEVEQTNPPTSDHLLDWLNDSISIVPSILDDPYACQWWEPDRDQTDDPNLLSEVVSEVVSRPTTSEIAADGRAGSGHGHSSNIPPAKKRKPNPNSASIDQRRRNIISHGDGREERGVSRRTTQNGKKPPGAKGNGGNNANGSNKEARWAEQLLNPCAEAIAAGNASRVQHYLCVLQELASVSGDANYRLAAHGLRALTRHVSAPSGAPTPTPPFPAPMFASTDPKVFHDSLIRFNEISPWFSFPNAVANASIVQMLSSEPYRDKGTLRIVDIGVSHGVQWPTLLEALTRRPGGPPSLVRLTVVVPAPESQSPAVPFSVGPPGDDFPSRLLRFAKRIDLNLQIETLEGGLQALLQAPKRGEETLVVCAQFRLHQLGNGGGHGGHGEEKEDERSEFFRRVKGAGPDLVVVSEEERGEEEGCGGFAAGFARRVGVLWRFLDSTSAAFKGRECVERRVMEGEAATALGDAGEMMKEGRRGWCDRLRSAGFVAEPFGEDAVDGGRALLRKYDGNWEMKMEEESGGGVICLCWKGQPVSFCSLWKLPVPDPNSAAGDT